MLLGPNGSGKSTLFDVLRFLSECFTDGLPRAWDRRGRFRELRTRGQGGPITFELTYRESPTEQPATYHLEIDESPRGEPVVAVEWLQWRRVAQSQPGAPYKILSYKNGTGWVIGGDPSEGGRTRSARQQQRKVRQPLDAPELLAVSTLGQLQGHPRVAALRRFISQWYVSYLSAADARHQAEAGAHMHLSRTGDNLANVVQFLRERHAALLEEIFDTLRARVPRIERVTSEPTLDGKLVLLIKDAPFSDPVLARFASDGTLKMLAYLVVLLDPEPPPCIGIEEPENYLHPRLLPELAEECRRATERSQLLVTTHSPFFLDGIRPDEVRILSRDESGFTRVTRASDVRGIPEHIAAGATLGALWLEGYLGDDPRAASRSARRAQP